MLSTKGAAAKLGCSVDWVRKLAAAGEIKAYIYVDGVLAKYVPGLGPRQGQGLYFQEKDITAYKPPKRGRAVGAKDKAINNPNRRGPKKAESANE